MYNFFVDASARVGDSFRISGKDHNHICNVLRMQVGSHFLVSCDGVSSLCRLTHAESDTVVAEIVEEDYHSTELSVRFYLFQGLPKGDKMDLIVQKAVELGACRIVPFESSRCIKRPKAEKAEKTTERLNRIAHEAAKQCGRARLPEVSVPVSFSEMVKIAAESQLALFCYEAESETTLKNVFEDAADISSVAVVIGCEGGFSQEEARACTEA